MPNGQVQPLHPDDPDFKERVFQRSLKQYNKTFNKGEIVKIKGTPLRGTIIQTYQDLELVQWNNNKPLYIEVELDNGERRVCHPQHLKRKSK